MTVIHNSFISLSFVMFYATLQDSFSTVLSKKTRKSERQEREKIHRKDLDISPLFIISHSFFFFPNLIFIFNRMSNN